MFKLKSSLCAVIFILFSGSVQASFAQGGKTTLDGIYTDAQASRGKEQYMTNCSSCHGSELQGVEDNPTLTSDFFLGHWTGKPLSALFDFISTQMPAGSPGSLQSNAYADALAFILSKNGLPAGTAELPADDKALGAITIAAKK